MWVQQEWSELYSRNEKAREQLLVEHKKGAAARAASATSDRKRAGSGSSETGQLPANCDRISVTRSAPTSMSKQSSSENPEVKEAFLKDIGMDPRTLLTPDVWEGETSSPLYGSVGRPGWLTRRSA